MSKDYKDMWQIFIAADTDQNVIVTINKNDSVADLFKTFRAKQKVFRKERRLTLLLSDGSDLQEDDQTRLVDIDGLFDKCTIQLIVHVEGGRWSTEIEVVHQIRGPTSVQSPVGQITGALSAVMDMDDETARVSMSCGHVIAPSSLAAKKR